jgi:hypothetical protein
MPVYGNTYIFPSAASFFLIRETGKRMNIRIGKIAPVLFFIYAASLFGVTAVHQKGLFERDGYYHARYARMMPDRGLSRSFPWTQLSTWNSRFCDKEFLYHLAMMPFARIGHDPLVGAWVFALLLSVTVLAVLYVLLRSHHCPWPLYFAAIPLASGGLFIARLGMIRSHVLSMILLLIGTHFLLRRKWKLIAVLGFVYAWSYTMPFVLLMTALPFIAGRFIAGREFDWKSPLAALVGAALGLIIHPYSPITLESILTYVQVFTLGMSGIDKSGFELGNEIYPYPFPVFFDIYPLVVILVPLLAVYGILQWKKLTPHTFGIVFSAVFWLGMTAFSARFVEYSVLFLALACGFVIRDTLGARRSVTDWLSNHARFRRAIILGVGMALAAFHFRAMTFYAYYQTKAAPPRFFTGACAWMAKNLEPGETVINLFWDDFPELFYDGYRQHYLWGLDPTYSIRENQAKANILERMRSHKIFLDGPSLAGLFNSRYLILRKSREKQYPELILSPFVRVYKDSAAVVYKIALPAFEPKERPDEPEAGL